MINKQLDSFLDSILDSFPLILTTEILSHCKDYEILKSIQNKFSKINDLFTCPSQAVWKQLCQHHRYKYLLEKNCLLRRSFIWEMIYYQNWRVELNWIKMNCEIIRLINPERNLIKLMNDGTSLGLSYSLDSKLVKIVDLKNGGKPIGEYRNHSGQITSSCLEGGKLILGKSCGSLTIFKISERTEITIKLHSKEITSIILYEEDFIISGDISGQIFKTTHHTQDIGNKSTLLCKNDSGITGLHRKGREIFATTMDGILIKILIRKRDDEIIIKKMNCFDSFGGINCITSTDELLILGTDSGILNILRYGKKGLDQKQDEKNKRAAPIISIATDSKRIISGHLDGTISILAIETGEEGVYRWGNAPIWSVGIDEVSFITASLDGEVILRNFL